MSGGTRGRLREVTAAGCDGAAFSPVAVHWGLLRSAPAFRLAAAFAARFISVRNARWCASVVAAVFALSAAAGTASAQMFPFTGSEQTYVVPSAATLVHVVAIGAPGGRNGAFQAPGSGAVVSADLHVSSSQILYIEVGGPGMGFSTVGPTGGFNGGGSGGVSFTAGWAPGGGGASDVRTVPSAQAGSLASRLIVAGGGGGTSEDGNPGGAAGFDAPSTCSPCGGIPPRGGQAGSATAGGAGGPGCNGSVGDGSSGGLGQGGMGGLGEGLNGSTPAGPRNSGGGGGGGYFGGGGGGGEEGPPPGFPPFCAAPDTGGGGGGSSFVTPNAMNAAFGLDSTQTPEVTITPVMLAVNISSPSISGTAVDGHTLTEAHGAWANDPTSYSYQWEKCDAAGNSCSAISGATSKTFTLAGSDVGHTIRVEEIATNAAGSSAPARSVPTRVVQVPPGTSGTLTAGHLTVSGPSVTALVSCTGGPGATCRLTLTLTIIETVKAGEVIAVTAAKENGKKPRRKVVVLGKATFTLSAGQSKTVRLSLNRTGNRLLAKYHALKAKVAITESGRTVSTKTIALKAKPKKRKHQRAT